MTSKTSVVGVVGVLLACSACGGSDHDGNDGNGSGNGTGSGTVTDAWQSFCTGTFTRDYQVIEFDEPQFTARAGEAYLLADYGGATATMIYLRPVGPQEFEVTAATMAELPFTSTCTPASAVAYYAVFADVTVYADEALSSKICDLKAGTALPRTNTLSGYSAVKIDLFGPTTYEVYLNAFSAQCGGASSGYIQVQQTKSFTSNTWLPPILSVLAPR